MLNQNISVAAQLVAIQNSYYISTLKNCNVHAFNAYKHINKYYTKKEFGLKVIYENQCHI